MTLRIAKRFDFDAAHWLPNVPPSHKCHRMHGHTYGVEIILEGEPDERGMVADYADIEVAWQSLHAILDHRTLNDIKGLENPTTEVLAPWIIRMLTTGPRGGRLPIVAVRVYESSTTWCEAQSLPKGTE